jgi:DNA modification methylase
LKDNGSGRVGIQAQRMGLDFVGIELSESYVSLARKLLSDASPLFSGLDAE